MEDLCSCNRWALAQSTVSWFGISWTLLFAQFALLIAAQTHPRVIRTPGFQIKQPMIEDIRSDTVAWSLLNLLSNYISSPGLFLTPRTRNDSSSWPLSVDRCLSPGLLLCVQLPLVPELLSVRSTEPYTRSWSLWLLTWTPTDHIATMIIFCPRSYFNPIVFQTRSHFNPIIFQPRSHFNHTPCNWHLDPLMISGECIFIWSDPFVFTVYK